MAQIPTSGLIGNWPFNGNANDVSGNSNDGTLLTGVSLTTDRFGAANSAYLVDGIDGTNNGITLPNTLDNTGSYTISIWFQLNDTDKTVTTAAQCVFSGNPHTSLAVGYGHPYYPYKMGSCIGDGSSWLQCSGSGIEWDLSAKLNWHNLIVVKSLTSYDYYIDGASAYTYPTTSSYNIGSFTLLLGAINTSSGEVFNGKLDDVAVWNRALTPTEITDVFTVTSINETTLENKISIYPNPANNLITLNATKEFIGTTYSIVDLVGRTILSGKINAETSTINIQELSEGIYAVKIGEKNQQSFKVIKK